MAEFGGAHDQPIKYRRVFTRVCFVAVILRSANTAEGNPCTRPASAAKRKGSLSGTTS